MHASFFLYNLIRSKRLSYVLANCFTFLKSLNSLPTLHHLYFECHETSPRVPLMWSLLPVSLPWHHQPLRHFPPMLLSARPLLLWLHICLVSRTAAASPVPLPPVSPRTPYLFYSIFLPTSSRFLFSVVLLSLLVILSFHCLHFCKMPCGFITGDEAATQLYPLSPVRE